MQAYGFDRNELTTIERTIFKFLWSSNEVQNGIDRIKRSIMKNEYSKGGMKVTDVESLNSSLKLKQFIRAHNSNHVIKKIQEHLSNDTKSRKSIRQEYSTVTDEEPISQSAQETMNLICDYNRNLYTMIPHEKFESDRILINEISSINLKDYLSRKKHVLMLCMVKHLTEKGIDTLGELTQMYEYETNEKSVKIMKLIMTTFPKQLVEISRCYVEGVNTNDETTNYIMMENESWKEIKSVTVKDLQILMKNVLKKTETQDFNTRVGITNFKAENIDKIRRSCHNAKLRNIYFRLINNDFFTHEKMKRFKMTETDACPRCGITEKLEHLVWGCTHSRAIWEIYNEIMREVFGQNQDCVNSYEDVYEASERPCINIIRLKIIQEMIQIERPTNWNKNKVKEIIINLVNIEKYNSIKFKTETKFHKKWNNFKNLRYET